MQRRSILQVISNRTFFHCDRWSKRSCHFVVILSAFFLFSLVVTDVTNASEPIRVYSARQKSIVDHIFRRYTQESGVEVEVLYIAKGLIDRIRHEGILSPADIVLTSDLPSLIEAANEDLLFPLKDTVLEAAIPNDLRDDQGRWFGMSQRIRLVYVHHSRVPVDAIQDFRDLADPKWQGRVCMRSAFHDYNLTLFSAIRAYFGHEELEKFLIGLKANLAYKPQGNDRYQVKSIWQGKCDLSLGNSYYYGLMLQNPEQRPWADSVNTVFARLGEFGNHVNVSAAGILRSTSQVDKAAALLRFLISEPIQQLYAKKTFEYPVIDNAHVVAPHADASLITLTDISKHREPTLKLLHKLKFDN